MYGESGHRYYVAGWQVVEAMALCTIIMSEKKLFFSFCLFAVHIFIFEIVLEFKGLLNVGLTIY